jgi:hypothetical protein
MGRHNAANGSSVHPLVAEGLARRAVVTAASPGGSAEHEQRSGEVGWPAPPNKGSGLGWPGDLDHRAEAAPESADPPRLRRGWRRFFGLRTAA